MVMKNETNKLKVQILREKAQTLLHKKHQIPNPEVWKDDISTLLEELSVHQIELEMQNDELLVTQELLQNEKQKYQDLYDFAPIAYLTFNETGNILELNHSAARLFGKRRESFQLNSIFPFLTDECKNDFRLMVKNAFSYGVEVGELTFQDVSNNTIHAKVQLSVFLEKEVYEKLCWMTITDITKQRNIETTLRDSEQKLRELNALKDKFFSIISHDLKGPIGSIVNILGLLEKEIEKESSEQKHTINLLQVTAKQTQALLEDLLLWSRSQSNRVKFNPIKIDIKWLINDIVLFQKYVIANKKEINISIDIQDEDVSVFADMEMIKIVFRNLLANAIKFTQVGGSVKVGCEPAQNGKVLFYISDTGVGISDENQAKLFKLEEHYTTKGTNQERGTGLGLIICKEFIERNGGNIFVESSEGKGSKFSFTLKTLP